MVEPAMFRDVLAQWPSGVTVVTTVVDGAWHGMTASSFSSVSLNPPLVSICLDRSLYTHGLIRESGVFGVSVLAKDQTDVARRFAGMVDGVSDRFLGETWSVAGTGTPLLDSALGWVDCRVVHEHPGGDHTIFVGEVVAAHTARRTAPLLFHSRGWGQFADVLPDVATLSDGALVSTLVAPGRGRPVGREDGEARPRVRGPGPGPGPDPERRARGRSASAAPRRRPQQLGAGRLRRRPPARPWAGASTPSRCTPTPRMPAPWSAPPRPSAPTRVGGQ